MHRLIRCSFPLVATRLFSLLLCGLVHGAHASPFRETLEKRWLEEVRKPVGHSGYMLPEQDAFGAVNGIRHEDTGFHTMPEEKPWWQVDLRKSVPIGRIVISNRASCQERNNRLEVYLAADAANWRRVYRHNGTVFHGGCEGTEPLTVELAGQEARYVRMQIDSGYLHLNEVEVYARGDNTTNVALEKRATQSSSSPWSTLSLKEVPPRDPDEPAPVSVVSVAHVEALLALMTNTLAFVETLRPLPALATRVDALHAAFTTGQVREAERDAFYLQIRHLRREIIMSHPLLDFDRLLINKRGPTLYSHQCDQYLGMHSQAGAGLVILDNWKRNPKESVLLKGRLPAGSVLHPDLSYDARRVLFGFCDHTQQDRQRRRYWIYEAAVDGTSVRQLTGTPADPLETWENRHTVLIEDWDPCYLPGGGFLFVSTRCQTFGRCHGSRYTPSYMLYRAEADGSGIRQVSFGEANEWQPCILDDGRAVYTRWDYINRHDVHFQSLWSARTDGTDVRHFYGNNTPNPQMITSARPIPGSSKISALAMGHHSYTAGSIIAIDRSKGEDGLEPVTRITPEVRFPESEGWPMGCFSTPWPLSETLYLAAYQPDRMTSQPTPQALNAFAIYLVDTLGGRELIYLDPEISCFAPIPLVPRKRPPVQSDGVLAASDGDSGIFYVQDVYASTEPLERGSAKRLRVNQILGQPARSKPNLSTSNNEVLKRTLGSVPIDPTGSVAFRAPAGVPLQFQLLDENDMSILTMRTVTYLHAGEHASCVGCHEPRSQTAPPAPFSHTRIRDIEPPPGPDYAGGFSFVRSVQPVLDRYCIGCHGLEAGEKSATFSLLGTPTDYSVAYDNLMQRPGVVAVAYRNSEKTPSGVKDYFAHAGSLAGLLLDGHPDKDGHKRVTLDASSRQQMINWLDLNGQFYGDYSHNRLERRAVAPEGERALRDHVRQCFGDVLAAQPLSAFVNSALAEESRILKAPLAVAAGGWGQMAEGGWTSTSDEGYRAMRALVEAVFRPLGRQDIAGTCGGGKHCSCGCCWVREAYDSLRESLATGDADVPDVHVAHR